MTPRCTRPSALLLTVLGLAACVPPASVRPASAVAPVDPLALLVALLPVGATSCIAVRTARVVDRRRSSAARLSRAGVLAWARSPHVSAYLRCDVGFEHARVELFSIDELDLADRAAVREALGLSVRFADEVCEFDECDLPLVEAVGGALRLSRRSVDDVSEPGVERALRRWVHERPDAIEVAVRPEGVRLVVPATDGLTVLERTDAGEVSETSSWEELEFAVEDRRISHEAWSARAEARFADVADLPNWSGEFLLSQLTLRLARSGRSGSPSDGERAAIGVIARHALAHFAGDLALVAEAARALVVLDSPSEALAIVDDLARSAAGDAARLEALFRLGREVAVLGHDASATARLVRGGIAADSEAVVRVVESLGALVETFGMTYESAEDVVAAAELGPSEAPGTAPLEVTVSARALLALLWLPIRERDAHLDLEVWLRGEALHLPGPRSSPGLSLVPGSSGLYVRATGRVGERLLALSDILESALAAPASTFEVVVRVRGESGRTASATGTCGASTLRLGLASAEIARLPAALVERALAQPLDELLARRFPAARLTWALVEGDPSVESLERALRAADVRGCEVTRATIECEPGARGASDGLDMLIAIGEALDAL